MPPSVFMPLFAVDVATFPEFPNQPMVDCWCLGRVRKEGRARPEAKALPEWEGDSLALSIC